MGLVAAPTAGSVERECTRSDLSVRLRLDRSLYEAGQPVRMRMVTRNVSDSSCTMVWSDGNMASLVVRDQDGNRIWDDEACKVYTQAIIEERWSSGHAEAYRGVWRQHTAGSRDTCRHDGPLAKRGLYFARGIFHGAGGVRSNRVQFRLRG